VPVSVMNDARQQEETLFEAARKLTEAVQRKAFLDAACAGNPELRRRLDVLLSAEPAANRFFEEGGAALNTPGGPQESATGEGGKGGTVRVILPAEEQPGTRISHYKLLEKIGEGGCGVVYVAEQEEPVRRRIALKVIKPGMDTRQVVARFEAERQALAMMDHPNIAKVLDAGTTENGRPYFVMELVRGIRITDYCDQNHLDANQRLELFILVCNAVQHAHQKGIIHRDLKPSNILVTLHDGVPVPKIIDFGIAKATEGRLTDLTVYTQLHQFIGTPAYMSPEQAEMSGLDIDTRSDIYSLGVLLYELLTGDTPFDAKELLKKGLDEIRRTIREVEPPKPSTRLTQQLVAADVRRLKSSGMGDAATEEEIRASSRRLLQMKEIIPLLRGDLDWIVMKCLEKDRTRRYETANGLTMDLKRFLHNEPVVARPPSAVYRLEKLVRRNKITFAAGTIVVLTLVVGLGMTTWALLREHKARTEADLRRKEAEKARLDEQQQRLRAEAEELTARRFAYASDMNLVQQALAANNLGRAREVLQRNRPKPGQPDLRGWEWRYLWQRCRGDSLFTLYKQPDSVMMVAFADEGKMVVFRDVFGVVRLWDPTNRKQIIELPGVGQGRALAVSQDSTLLAYGSTNGNRQPIVQLWNVRTQRAMAQLQNGGFPVSLAFGRGGKTLAVYATDRVVRIWDLETQHVINRIQAQESGGHQGAVALSPDGEWLAVGELNGEIRLLDLLTAGKDRRIGAADESVTALAFSPDSKLLASGSGFADKTIRLWTVATGEAAGTLAGHDSWVSSLTFAPDARTLASASGDQTIRFWDVANHKQISLLRGHLNEVYSLAFSPDGKKLVSSSKDGEVKVWDATVNHGEQTSLNLPVPVFKFAFSPDSKDLVTLNRDGAVVVWDPVNARQREITSTVGGDGEMAISADGKLLAIGDQTGVLKVWDRPARREMTNFVLCAGRPLYVEFPGRGKELFVVDCERKIRRWETDFWREKAPWKIDQKANAACLSPDGRLLGSGYNDGTVTIWEVASGRLLERFMGHRRMVTGVAFSPDGKLMATGSEDGLTKLWDPDTGQELTALRGTLLSVHSVTVSSDGQRLATGSNAKEAVKLWDLPTWQEVANLEGHGSFFYRTEFSPDGNVLVSVNIDGLFHLWRAPSLTEIDAVEMADAKPN